MVRRREADGVAWYLARKAARGQRPPNRGLALYWTAHTGQQQVPLVLPRIVEEINAAFAPLEMPLRPQGLSVALGAGPAENLPWGEAGLARIAQRFAEDAPGRVALELVAPPDPAHGPRSLDLSIHASFWDHKVWTGLLLGRMGQVFLAEGLPSLDRTAEALVAAVTGVSRVADAVWGAVTLDHIPSTAPPYEYYFGISPEHGDTKADAHPRGYYWANVLSAGHVAALGGVTDLARRCAELGLSLECPDRADDESALVLVRDPAPVSAFSDDRLAAVRDLLDPILQHHPYHWYAGPPMRVIKEPGTAYLPIPADLNPQLPVFDDDEPLPEGDDW